MILLILKSYLTILISIGVSAFCLLVIRLYFIFSFLFPKKMLNQAKLQTNQDAFLEINADQLRPEEVKIEGIKTEIKAVMESSLPIDMSTEKNKLEKKILASQADMTSQQAISTDDFDAISGEDVLATQLDLARAYLETDKKALAKTILDAVMKEGNSAQREEAQLLIALALQKA